MGVASAHLNARGIMGRIAESATLDGDTSPNTYTCKLDTILDSLDDEDRAVVLGWLRNPSVTDEELEERLFVHDIACSDSTIRRWRRAQARGRGRVWVG